MKGNRNEEPKEFRKRVDLMRKTLKRMKRGKAVGPDDMEESGYKEQRW